MSGFRTLTTDRPVRLVQVGAGAMGRAWLEAIAEHAGAELVGLVDIDLAHAERVAADVGGDVVVGTDVVEVATRAGADAVIDVTVPQAHHAVNTAALLAGFPVLCEKPIAPTVAETLSLVAAAELSGELLMTSQSRRYYPELAAFRTAIDGIGGAGLLSVEFFKAPRFGGFRDTMAHPLLIDMAIHAFDVARYLIDSEPVRVDCRSWNPAWSWYAGDAAASATFEFAGGERFVYTGSWCSPGLETSWNGSWRASGPGGTALWDGDNAPTTGDGAAVAVDSDGPREIRGALAEFLEVLRTGRVPSGEVHANVRSLAMVEAAVRSADERVEVGLDRVLDDAYARALADETRDDVRARLQSWGSAAVLGGRA